MLPRTGYELRAAGEVVVHVRIDADGLPTDDQVVRAVGAGAEERILLAVSKWTFTPARRAGMPVASQLDLTFPLAPPQPK